MAVASSKATRNERRKLRATSLNAVGLAVFAVGVIQPIYNGAFSTGLALRVAVSAAIAYSVHWLAGLSLGKLED